MTPLITLKAALHVRLSSDLALIGLLGGAKIYDETPRDAITPYLVFGDAVCRDNGTVSDSGHITELTLAAWSRQGGTREALVIANRAESLLDDAEFELDGHRLIQCRVTSSDVRREAAKDLTRVLIRIRTVTEVL